MLEFLPPLGSLHAFALVIQTGSLSGAASRLNVTQPAVSKRIRLLEKHLGVALVSRGVNSLSLTPAGRQYAATITEALSAISDATAALDKRAAHPLRVCAYTTWALHWLIPRLPRFKALHPSCEVEVTASLDAIDFARGQLDAAIRTAAIAPSANAVKLQEVKLAPFAAAPKKAADLQEMTILGSKAQPGYWDKWSSAVAVPLGGRPLLFESTSMAVQAAMEGLGAVIVHPALVEIEVRRGRLRRMDRREVPTGDSYWFMLAPGRPRPETLAFRDWLIKESREEA